MALAKQLKQTESPIYLIGNIGNLRDTVDTRIVSYEQMKEYASTNGLKFYETSPNISVTDSARNVASVKDIFSDIEKECTAAKNAKEVTESAKRYQDLEDERRQADALKIRLCTELADEIISRAAKDRAEKDHVDRNPKQKISVAEEYDIDENLLGVVSGAIYSYSSFPKIKENLVAFKTDKLLIEGIGNYIKQNEFGVFNKQRSGPLVFNHKHTTAIGEGALQNSPIFGIVRAAAQRAAASGIGSYPQAAKRAAAIFSSDSHSSGKQEAFAASSPSRADLFHDNAPSAPSPAQVEEYERKLYAPSAPTLKAGGSRAEIEPSAAPSHSDAPYPIFATGSNEWSQRLQPQSHIPTVFATPIPDSDVNAHGGTPVQAVPVAVAISIHPQSHAEKVGSRKENIDKTR